MHGGFLREARREFLRESLSEFLRCTRVSELKARLDTNPRLPNKEMLKIVDALSDIGNLPMEVLKEYEN